MIDWVMRAEQAGFPAFEVRSGLAAKRPSSEVRRAAAKAADAPPRMARSKRSFPTGGFEQQSEARPMVASSGMGSCVFALPMIPPAAPAAGG